MIQPFFTIVIASYNAEKYLQACLESVLNQSFKDFEIVIVDDASTDNTLQIIKEYAKKNKNVRYYVNKKNLGVGSNKQKCLELAQGKFTYFLDNDDEMIEDFLQKTHKQIANKDINNFLGIKTSHRVINERNNTDLIKPSQYYKTFNTKIVREYGAKIYNVRNEDFLFEIFIDTMILYHKYQTIEDYDIVSYIWYSRQGRTSASSQNTKKRNNYCVFKYFKYVEKHLHYLNKTNKELLLAKISLCKWAERAFLLYSKEEFNNKANFNTLKKLLHTFNFTEMLKFCYNKQLEKQLRNVLYSQYFLKEVELKLILSNKGGRRKSYILDAEEKIEKLLADDDALFNFIYKDDIANFSKFFGNITQLKRLAKIFEIVYVSKNGLITVKQDDIKISSKYLITNGGTIKKVLIGKEYDFDLKNEDYVMIDIGFNLGATSLYFAGKNNIKKIYGFEPFKYTIKEAKFNLKQNKKLSKKIKLFPFGLSSEKKIVKVNYLKNRMCNMSTYKNIYQDNEDAEIVKLKLHQASKILFPIIKKHKEKIFLKIDCEGEEINILPELEKSGILKNIDVIIMEFHENSSEELIKILQQNNFKTTISQQEEKTVGQIRAIKNF